MLQDWVLLSILAGLASNTFHFLSRFVLKEKDDPTVYAWFFEFIRLLVFASFAIIDWKIVITGHSIFLFILLGFTELLGIYWIMKMHSYSHLSISTILSRTRLIWVPIIGFFLLGEALKLTEYIGIFILFIGLSIAVAPRKLLIDKGIKYAQLAAFMIALHTVLIKMALPFASNSVLNALIVLQPAILLPLFMKNPQKRIATLFHKKLFLKTLAIGINILSVYLFFVALRLGDVSKVNAVYQGMMVFSVVAGVVILNEKENIYKKFLGTAIALIGIITLNIF